MRHYLFIWVFKTIYWKLNLLLLVLRNKMVPSNIKNKYLWEYKKAC